jgi:hypothetical protein
MIPTGMNKVVCTLDLTKTGKETFDSDEEAHPVLYRTSKGSSILDVICAEFDE